MIPQLFSAFAGRLWSFPPALQGRNTSLAVGIGLRNDETLEVLATWQRQRAQSGDTVFTMVISEKPDRIAHVLTFAAVAASVGVA